MWVSRLCSTYQDALYSLLTEANRESTLSPAGESGFVGSGTCQKPCIETASASHFAQLAEPSEYSQNAKLPQLHCHTFKSRRRELSSTTSLMRYHHAYQDDPQKLKDR